MPIRINLLAEELAEEEMRRQDPVKRAIFLGAFLVVLTLVWFSAVWLEHMLANNQLGRIQSEISSHTNEFFEVQASQKKVADIRQRRDSLQQLSAARFLQGSLLNALQKTHVPNVQLTRLRVEQSYLLRGGTPSKTNDFGVVPGRAPTVTEQIVLTLDAKDYSQNQGDQVNHYKDALMQQEYFRSNLAPNGIRLSSLSPQQLGLDSRAFVLFTLECRFLERIQ